ncbi:tRNA pseudouridine13 synthase [Geothermobacter ehrlichii]|uniref:tRNA pseudouridine synthase D n=1 Tax=Geothermobacter ehrlichii TaxID=213224 RepID=A0A5D3WHH6_9BACT|nr:tRNA pseudouridine(13) synthase TruD [Geothermobacter ehrlichii]TYO97519.1 tRNA pseudouridine13 synthase [Geothermobacter ehrlichii]
MRQSLRPGHLTAALPGTGGVIRQEPEDFRVEEIPLYPPCGEGDHLYLRLEKIGLGTLEVVRLLAATFGLRERDIGYAGLKDTRAVTIQTFSLPGIAPDQTGRLAHPGLRLLEAVRHGNKLRLGHLAGNRFSIRLRNTVPDAQQIAADVLAVLQDLGVPNFFGPQRYGVLGNNGRVGAALLRREYRQAIAEIIGDPQQIDHAAWRQAATAFHAGDLQACLRHLPARMRDERRMIEALADGRGEKQALFSLPRRRLRLYLSALQAELFDRLLAMRLSSIERLWPGDIAWKHDNGACFRVEDPQREQPRADRFEISPTGPLFGRKILLASGQAGLLEQSLLDKFSLQPADFRLGDGLTMDGERRPLRVPLDQVDITKEGDGLRLGFVLPRGSFATSVLREVMKSDVDLVE